MRSHRPNSFATQRRANTSAHRHTREQKPSAKMTSGPMFFKRHQSTLTGLPFQVTREQVNNDLAKNKRFLEETGNHQQGALALYKADPITECFVPFHSADVKKLRSVFVGERGHDRTEYYWATVSDGKETRQELRTRTVTDWYRCSGTMPYTDYPFGTLQTQTYAGFAYPRVLVENALQCYDIVNIAPITKEMLNFGGKKKVVFPHEMNMPYFLEKLNANMYDAERSRALAFIRTEFNADQSRLHTLDVYLSEADINLISYHIPAYIYRADVSSLQSYKIINGFSGKMYGNSIYSVIKSSMVGAGVGGFLSLGFALVTRPYLLIPQVLLRVAIGSSFSGMLWGLIAKWSNASDNSRFISGMKNELDENAKYPETDDDIERRKFAAEMNEGIDYKASAHGKNIRLPIDKCKLLDLDPEQDITLEMVKKAYHRKIKCWHPDLFRENNAKKAQAEAMTKQLNDANAALTRILQNKPI